MRIIQSTTTCEYSICKRKTGYPKDVRTGWNLAPLDVPGTPAANTQNLASQAQLLSDVKEQTSTFQPNVNALTLRTFQQPTLCNENFTRLLQLRTLNDPHLNFDSMLEYDSTTPL